jgi:hypothetical protein
MEGSENINIRVKTLDGAEHTINLPRTSSINTLKSLVEAKTGILPAGQRIIYQGRMLNDDMVLNSVGINDQSVVHCVERAPPSETTVNPTSEDDSRNNSNTQRNRVRAQMERHVRQERDQKLW